MNWNNQMPLGIENQIPLPGIETETLAGKPIHDLADHVVVIQQLVFDGWHGFVCLLMEGSSYKWTCEGMTMWPPSRSRNEAICKAKPWFDAGAKMAR